MLEGDRVHAAPPSPHGVGADDPVDRPMDVFGGANTLHFPADDAPFLLLPVIPAR